jgi:GGDEF domain-containing protein
MSSTWPAKDYLLCPYAPPALSPSFLCLDPAHQLLIDCPLDDAQRLAQSIVEAVAAIEFDWKGTAYRIGASVGVVALGADQDPLAAADHACYAAKRSGRGRVSVDRTALR